MNVPTLRFPEFEGELKTRRIGDIAIVKTGSRDTQNRIKDGEYPFFVRSDKIERINSYDFDGEAILTSGDGVGVGKNIHYINGKFDYHQRVYAIRDFIDDVDGQFFFQFFRENFLRRVMRLSAKNSVDSVRMSMITDMFVPTPSLPEQKKIAAFLGVVDEKLAALRARRAGLETYKRGLMQKLFSRTLRFTKPDGSAFPDWKDLHFSDFLVPTLRAVPKPNDEYLAIGIRSHGKGTFQKPNSDPDKIAMDTLYVVRENDLIVNITFAWEGAIAIVPAEDDGGHVSHRFPTYVFRQELVSRDFFRIVIADRRFRQKLDLISPGGAGRNRVMSKPEFLKLRYLFPTLQEQTRIAEAFQAMDAKISAVADQINRMEAFKKGLLQQMFV